MKICSFEEKQKQQEKLLEKGVSTPFLRSEEKGQSLAREIVSRISKGQKVVFVCCGDLEGMALLSAARLVHAAEREVVIGIVGFSPSFAPMGWKIFIDLLKKRGVKTIFFLDKKREWEAFFSASIGGAMLIATFFSHWKSRMERQSFGEWAVRSFPAVIGIELPLGYPEAVPVQETWCFDFPVEEIMDYPLRGLAGRQKILMTYGIEKDIIGTTSLSTPEDVAGLLRLRQPEGHKGTFGRLLIVGGSEYYPGAVHLAAQGGLHSGCGLVTVATELAMYGRDSQVTYLPLPPQQEREVLEGYLQKLHTSSILIGNGWGDSPHHVELLRFLLLQPYVSHLVLDADALNLVARFPELFEILETQTKLCGKNLVLTPHGGEIVRLLRVTPDVFRLQRKELTLGLAEKVRVTIVQKNATTLIATPTGEVWYSCYGNDALAKGGSGDILAGLVGGLLATGYDGRDAALVATFLLGTAAELFTKKFPAEAATPLRLVEFLPEAWKVLYSFRYSLS